MRAGSRGSLRHCRGRAAQTDPFINAPQQHYTAVRTDVAALEIRLYHAATQAPKTYRPIGTLWHRQSSVVIGVEYQ